MRNTLERYTLPLFIPCSLRNSMELYPKRTCRCLALGRQISHEAGAIEWYETEPDKDDRFFIDDGSILRHPVWLHDVDDND